MVDVHLPVFQTLNKRGKIIPEFPATQIEFRITEDAYGVTVTLEDYGGSIESFFRGKSLILDHEKTYKFINKIREISPFVRFEIYPVSASAIDINPKIYSDLNFYEVGRSWEELATDIAERDGWERDVAISMWYHALDEVDYNNFAEDTENAISKVFSDLNAIFNIINEYRKFDITKSTLNDLLKEAINEHNIQKKGKTLENLLVSWIRADDKFDIKAINLRTESEEIDIVIEASFRDNFIIQLQSPVILIECKNWSKNVTAKEIRNFAQKVQNRPRFLCKIGLIITTSDYTDDANKELIGYRGKDYLIATANGNNLIQAIEKGEIFSDFFKKIIIKSGII